MKKIYTALAIFFCFAHSSECLSQTTINKTINGYLREKDSGIGVTNAKVIPRSGKAQYSNVLNKAGDFKLTYLDKQAGDDVRVEVQKEGYEIFSETGETYYKDLTIPTDPTTPRIIVLVNIAKRKQKELEYQKFIAEIPQLQNEKKLALAARDAAEKKYWSLKDSTNQQALIEANKKIEAVNTSNQEIALILSKVDKYSASDYVKDVLDKLEHGEVTNVDELISLKDLDREWANDSSRKADIVKALSESTSQLAKITIARAKSDFKRAHFLDSKINFERALNSDPGNSEYIFEFLETFHNPLAQGIGIEELQKYVKMAGVRAKTAKDSAYCYFFQGQLNDIINRESYDYPDSSRFYGLAQYMRVKRRDQSAIDSHEYYSKSAKLFPIGDLDRTWDIRRAKAFLAVVQSMSSVDSPKESKTHIANLKAAVKFLDPIINESNRTLLAEVDEVIAKKYWIFGRVDSSVFYLDKANAIHIEVLKKEIDKSGSQLSLKFLFYGKHFSGTLFSYHSENTNIGFADLSTFRKVQAFYEEFSERMDFDTKIKFLQDARIHVSGGSQYANVFIKQLIAVLKKTSTATTADDINFVSVGDAYQLLGDFYSNFRATDNDSCIFFYKQAMESYTTNVQISKDGIWGLHKKALSLAKLARLTGSNRSSYRDETCSIFVAFADVDPITALKTLETSLFNDYDADFNSLIYDLREIALKDLSVVQRFDLAEYYNYQSWLISIDNNCASLDYSLYALKVLSDPNIEPNTMDIGSYSKEKTENQILDVLNHLGSIYIFMDKIQDAVRLFEGTLTKYEHFQFPKVSQSGYKYKYHTLLEEMEDKLLFSYLVLNSVEKIQNPQYLRRNTIISNVYLTLSYISSDMNRSVGLYKQNVECNILGEVNCSYSRLFRIAIANKLHKWDSSFYRKNANFFRTLISTRKFRIFARKIEKVDEGFRKLADL